jgi:hypothetical protein
MSKFSQAHMNIVKRSQHALNATKKFTRNGSLHHTKHRIRDQAGLILGLGKKTSLILHYFPFLWACHDYSVTSSILPKNPEFSSCALPTL